MSGNFSGIRLSWYVILSQMCFFALVILFVIASIHVNKLILADIIIGSSNDVFEKETLLDLKQIWIHQYHSQHLFENTFGTLQRINYIQQLVANSQRFTIQQPIECLKSYAVDSYCYNASMCYGIFDKLETIYQQEVLQTIFNVTSVLTEYRYAMLLEQKTPIFYTYDSDAQFFACTNENFVYPPGYLPHSRPWYTEFQASVNKERMFGLPYQIPSGEVRVPIMRGLMATNGSYCGVISEHIDFVKEIKYLLAQDKVLYILNMAGLVVFGQQYLNVGQKIFHIFNSSLTGFDEDDWTEILAFLNGQEFHNQCYKKYNYPNIMCRYNHLEQSDVLIQIMKISNSPYFILFYQQDQKIINQKNELIEIIHNTMQQIESSYYQVIGSCVTAVVFITQLLMTLTLKQTKLLIQYTYANVKVHSLKIIQQKMKKELVNLWIQSSTVTKLFEAADKWYNYLTKGSNNKNIICLELEKVEYPINNESINLEFANPIVLSQLEDEVCFENKDLLQVTSLRQIVLYCIHKRRSNIKFYRK